MSFLYNPPNQYPANCQVCGRKIPAYGGLRMGPHGNFVFYHNECYDKVKRTEAIERPCAVLSLADDDRVKVSFGTMRIPPAEFSRYIEATQKAGFFYDKAQNAQLGDLRGVLALIEAIQAAGFDVKVVDPRLTKRIQEIAEEARGDVEDADERSEHVDQLLAKRNLRLYDFQRKSVAWLAPRVSALLAHDQGLGKTIIALTSLPENAPVVIVGKANIKGTWLREMCAWRHDYGSCKVRQRAGLDYLEAERGITVCQGRESFVWPKPGEVVIVNYDILPVTPGEHRAAKLLLAEWEQHGRPERFVWVDPDQEVAENEEPKGTWVEADEVVAAQKTAERSPIAPPPEGTILIADELHYVRIRQKKEEKKSQRGKRFRSMAQYVLASSGRVWGLTGTPLLNEPIELWSLLEHIGAGAGTFGSYSRFIKLFHKTKDGRWIPSPQAAGLLRRCMLRFKKETALPELPAKVVEYLQVRISPEDKTRLDQLEAEIIASQQQTFEEVFQAEVEKAERREERKRKAKAKKRAEEGTSEDEGEEEELTGPERIRAAQEAAHAQSDDRIDLPEMSRALTMLANAKTPALARIVKEFMDRGEPLVVFANHLEPLRYIYEKFGKEANGFAFIHGGVPAAKRTAIEETFQRGRLKCVLGMIEAAGEGLTLTRASTVLFVEEHWTPAKNDQARDRVHRIGQFKQVTIKILVADHVMDELIQKINVNKRSLIKATIDAAAYDAGEIIPTEADDLDRAAEVVTSAEKTPKCDPDKSATGAAPARSASDRVPATTPRQEAIAQALRQIGTGGSADAGIAGSLARDLHARGLTEKQWAFAESIARRHPGLSLSLSPLSSPSAPGSGSSPGSGVGGSPPPSRFHGPVTPMQEWTARALQILSGSDTDRARERNDVGFNRLDGEFGHKLAKELQSGRGLSDPQWDAAIRMVSKYRRQVGDPPTAVARNPGDDYWHVIVAEPKSGRKTTLGITGPDDTRVQVYEDKTGAVVQRFELSKRSFEPEEAAEWARVHGIKWLRVEG